MSPSSYILLPNSTSAAEPQLLSWAMRAMVEAWVFEDYPDLGEAGHNILLTTEGIKELVAAMTSGKYRGTKPLANTLGRLTADGGR